jgi:hypothetical protein
MNKAFCTAAASAAAQQAVTSDAWLGCQPAIGCQRLDLQRIH